ncbi:MAG: hypothetical protein IKU78_04335 [Paludibacteraceae bacterium]|nr:hypothetical protein [Paludibacteraceae bacterium]
MSSDFAQKYSSDFEGYALMATTSHKEIFGYNLKSAPRWKGESLLKITANGRTIYRKYKAEQIKGASNYVALSYRSLGILGLINNKNKEVYVQKTCWLPFLWNYYDTNVRYTFRCTMVLGILSFLLGVVSLIFNFIYS